MGKSERDARTWPIFLAYGLGFLGEGLGGALFLLVVARSRVDGDFWRVEAEATRFALSAPGLMGASLASATALLIVAVVSALWLGGGGGVAARLRIGPSRASFQGVAAVIIGTAGLSLACGSAAQVVGVGQGRVMHTLAESLHHVGAPGYLLAIASFGVAPALAEESFFRGLMQTRLAERWPHAAAIGTTAAAFGLLHVDPVQGTLAFAVGLYLGSITERFHGIRPGIAAHAVNNLLFVTLSWFASPENSAAGVSRGTRATAGVILVIGAAACLASIAFVRSPRAVRSSISAS